MPNPPPHPNRSTGCAIVLTLIVAPRGICCFARNFTRNFARNPVQ